MRTDKQQIEELKNILINSKAVTFGKNVQKPYFQYRYDKFFLSNNDGYLTVDYSKFAEALYNANYRQVPKNAVVLTEEEYNALMLEQKRLKEIVDRIPCGYELKDKTRKETAREIYITGKYYYAKHSPMGRQLSDFLAHIKETYGVEVEE